MGDHWQTLTGLAAVTGVVHTLAGPDHYLPFVAISRARAWSRTRTAVVTLLCGFGHVLSSVVIGAIGVAAGVAIARLEAIEAMRGELAAWSMIVFGLLYGIWGLRRAARGHRHSHVHAHQDGSLHLHEHAHENAHVHIHEQSAAPEAAGKGTQAASSRNVTPWILFTIFVFGPCEVLIPQLLFPAATGSLGLAILVIAVFGIATIITMLTMVMALVFGLRRLRLTWLEKHMHTLAGATLVMCGALILLGF